MDILGISVVSPIHRVNTQDNTPAVIHYDMVKGDKIEIVYAPKGFGSENMSQLKMLKPSDGLDGIKKFIVDVCVRSWAKPMSADSCRCWDRRNSG